MSMKLTKISCTLTSPMNESLKDLLERLVILEHRLVQLDQEVVNVRAEMIKTILMITDQEKFNEKQS